MFGWSFVPGDELDALCLVLFGHSVAVQESGQLDTRGFDEVSVRKNILEFNLWDKLINRIILSMRIN